MVPRGHRWNARLHQLLATQAALALVLLGAANGGAIFAAAAFLAAGFLPFVWVRVSDHAPAALLGFRARRRTFRLDTPAAVLARTAPRTFITTADLAGAPAAVLVDDFGLTALVELAEPSAALPALRTLLPRSEARLQLVLTGVPATRGGGPATGSYRSLTDRRHDVLAQFTAVLAIRLPRSGGRSEEELRRLLLGLARRLIRRLRTHAARPLSPDAALRMIADLAHAEPADDAHELWTALHLGGLHQATFECRRDSGAIPAHLLLRLLHLPAAATTVALTTGALTTGALTTDAGSTGAESMLVRLATPDITALDNAARLLQRLLDPEGFVVRRWDGRHLAGLAATLPLGRGPTTARSGSVTTTRSETDSPGTPAVAAGLLLGRDRHGAPVPVTLFRSDPFRVLLVGGLACAQLLIFRALGTGARVTVHSTRPHEWVAFVRAAGDPIALLPADRPPAPSPGSLLRPALIVIDTDPGPESHPEPGPWQTTLLVRDHLDPADLTAATEADLIALQPLEPAEADLLGEALHLGDAAGHLTRIRPTMVALVSRRAVRWVSLAPTPVEKVLIGDLTRTKLNDKSRYD